MKQRMPRVNELIHHEMGDLVQHLLRDSNLGFVTVTEVRVSKDLHYAKIFFSVFGKTADKDKVLKLLEIRSPMLQRELGSRVRLRYTPSLQFICDETADKSDRIMTVFKKIEEGDKKG